MVIKQIDIDCFGKLNGRTFLFNEGINVIHGPNEAGKSTLQNFLLSCFYGARTSRKNGLDLRKRFVPYGKEYTFGTMRFLHDEEHYLAERKISTKRKDDFFRIYAMETYKQAPFSEHLGKELLDLDLDEFMKTLYITQNGTRFLNEKDESLSTKLTNLLESGDEDVSFTMAMHKLEKEMKLIRGPRKNGSLDQLYDELSGLHMKLHEAESDEKRLKDIDAQLNGLIHENETLEEKKQAIQILKEQIHLYQIKNEFFRIRKSMEELKLLKEQRQSRFVQVEEKELSAIREKENSLKDLEEDASLLEEHLESLHRKKAQIGLSLDLYAGYSDIGRDSIHQMIRLQGEEMLLEEKLKYFNGDASYNKNLIERRDELRKLLKYYEKHLMGLQSKRHLFLIGSGFLLLAAFLYHALTKDLMTSIFIGTFAFMVYSMGKVAEPKRVSYHMKKVDQVEEDIRSIAHELNMDPNEVVRSKKLIEKLPGESQRFALKARYDEVKTFKENVFMLTNTKTVEELLKGELEYESLIDTQKEVSMSIQRYEKDVISIKERKEQLLRTYMDLIMNLGYDEAVHDYRNFLDLYDLEMLRLKDIEIKEEGLEYALKGLVGDRSAQDVQNELDAISVLGIIENPDQETLEETERALSEREVRLSEEIDELKLERMERVLSDPLLLTDTILSLQQDEKALLRRYEVLELTKNVMKESYEKLRKEFTDRLNDRVTTIYAEITGTHRLIKVSDVFSMNYQESGNLYDDTFLSHGSMEQLYLSLRIAMADLIFKGRKVPLILDEAFSSFDEERLRNTLSYLRKRSDCYQIFIFTCHRREVDILGDAAHVILL